MSKRKSRKKRTPTEDSVLFRGMWFPRDEIDNLEQMFGGEFLFDAFKTGVLEYAIRKGLNEGKGLPDWVDLSSDPFTRYKPVRIDAKMLGMGMDNTSLPTNRFVFIEVKRIISVS
jgi:hypothetical protein